MEKNKLIKNFVIAFVLNLLLQTLILFVIAILMVVGITSPRYNKNDYSSNYGVENISYVENDYFYYEVGDTLEYLYLNYSYGGPSYFIGAPILTVSVPASEFDPITLTILPISEGLYDYCILGSEEVLTLSQWAYDNLGVEYPTNFLQLYDEQQNSIYFYNFNGNSIFRIESLGVAKEAIIPIPYNLINPVEHSILNDITSEFSNVSDFLGDFVDNLIPIFYTNNSLTFVGILTVAGLGFGVIFLVIYLIERFLHFRA